MMGTSPDSNGYLDKIMKRKLKNRASAARSRARREAYVHQLEMEVSFLKEKIELLENQKETGSIFSKPPSTSHTSVQNNPTAQEYIFPIVKVKTEPGLTHVNSSGEAALSTSHGSVQNNSPTTLESLFPSKPIQTEPDTTHINFPTAQKSLFPCKPIRTEPGLTWVNGREDPSPSTSHASARNNFPTNQQSQLLPKSIKTEPGLIHVNNNGEAEMMDISTKGNTNNVAIAGCRVLLGEKTFNLVAANQMDKGDVLNVAQVAGIMGAKQTTNLIPLCRTISATHVHLNLTLNKKDFAVEIEGKALSTGKTGIEMEAMTAVAVAGLTVFDMCKAASEDIKITDVSLKQE